MYGVKIILKILKYSHSATSHDNFSVFVHVFVDCITSLQEAGYMCTLTHTFVRGCDSIFFDQLKAFDIFKNNS